MKTIKRRLQTIAALTAAILALCALPVFAMGGGGGVKVPTPATPTASEDAVTPAVQPALTASGNWSDESNTDWFVPGSSTYQIGTEQDLAGLARLVNDGESFSGITIELTKDLHLAGRNWTPIGTKSSNAFAGTFDGNGHTIYGLEIANPSEPDTGLFGCVQGATIVNLTLNSVTITGSGTYVGGLVGYVDSTSTIGKITVKDCAVAGKMFVGGMIGAAQTGANIQTSRVIGNSRVEATTTAGGFAGMISTAKECYATTNVTGDMAGGFAGWIRNLSTTSNPKPIAISSCYCTGSVAVATTGSYRCGGGFAGNYYSNLGDGEEAGSWQSCYTLSSVTSAADGAELGAMLGTATSDIQTLQMSDLHYNSEKCTLNPVGNISVDTITGLTTAQMTSDTEWESNMGLPSSDWKKQPNTGAKLFYPYLFEFESDSAPYELTGNPITFHAPDCGTAYTMTDENGQPIENGGSVVVDFGNSFTFTITTNWDYTPIVTCADQSGASVYLELTQEENRYTYRLATSDSPTEYTVSIAPFNDALVKSGDGFVLNGQTLNIGMGSDSFQFLLNGSSTAFASSYVWNSSNPAVVSLTTPDPSNSSCVDVSCHQSKGNSTITIYAQRDTGLEEIFQFDVAAGVKPVTVSSLKTSTRDNGHTLVVDAAFDAGVLADGTQGKVLFDGGTVLQKQQADLVQGSDGSYTATAVFKDVPAGLYEITAEYVSDDNYTSGGTLKTTVSLLESGSDSEQSGGADSGGEQPTYVAAAVQSSESAKTAINVTSSEPSAETGDPAMLGLDLSTLAVSSVGAVVLAKRKKHNR